MKQWQKRILFCHCFYRISSGEVLLPLILHLTNPDVTEADAWAWVTMALQQDRTIAVSLHLWETDILGSTQNFGVVLQNNAILDDGNVWMYLICTISVTVRLTEELRKLDDSRPIDSTKGRAHSSVG